MRRRLVFAMAGACAGLSCAAPTGAVLAQTTAASTVAAAPGPLTPDPVAKLSLFAAAFAKGDVQPSPQRATAMAFLPGRGVVAWDVTGKTPEEAREAEIEAMGAADARAVQREIDAQAQKEAEQDAEARERRAFASEADAGAGGRVQRIALNVPAITGSAREADSILPLNHAARTGGGLGLRGGETLRGRGRVYAFAAISGRSVGVNVLHDEAGWKNAGLTTEREGFTGQRQAGLAWRKGGLQTSLSYVQQKDRTQILGMQTDKDHRVMVSMNVQPQVIAGLFAKKP